jgi:hypothetical protein
VNNDATAIDQRMLDLTLTVVFLLLMAVLTAVVYLLVSKHEKYRWLARVYIIVTVICGLIVLVGTIYTM